jgi:hypothetical protein
LRAAKKVLRAAPMIWDRGCVTPAIIPGDHLGWW